MKTDRTARPTPETASDRIRLSRPSLRQRMTIGSLLRRFLGGRS